MSLTRLSDQVSSSATSEPRRNAVPTGTACPAAASHTGSSCSESDCKSILNVTSRMGAGGIFDQHERRPDYPLNCSRWESG